MQDEEHQSIAYLEALAAWHHAEAQAQRARIALLRCTLSQGEPEVEGPEPEAVERDIDQGTANALSYAIRLAGTQVELARRIGGRVRQGHVWGWLRRGYVPAREVLPIVRAVAGGVTPYELRPDIYPDPDWMPSQDNKLAPEAIRDA